MIALILYKKANSFLSSGKRKCCGDDRWAGCLSLNKKRGCSQSVYMNSELNILLIVVALKDCSKRKTVTHFLLGAFLY